MCADHDPRIREWEKRDFFDPDKVLRDLRMIELSIATADIEDRVRRLRTGRLKGEREARDAALFAHGMSVAAGTPVFFSPGEAADADFITCFLDGDTATYTSVQLKELVPEDLNPNADLGTLLNHLTRRPNSDTVLAVRLNRRGRIEFSSINVAQVPFAEVWFFGSHSPDSSRWFLYGNVRSNPRFHEFAYPE